MVEEEDIGGGGPTRAREADAQRLWVPSGHFYSPLVDPEDVHVRKAIEEEAHPSVDAAALGLDEAEMLRWFSIIGRYYAANPFPEHPHALCRYHYANPHFPLADALAMLGVMAEKKPRRYIEVGSGYSSCAAIEINEKYLNGSLDMTFIEPYPDTFLKLVGERSKYAAGLPPSASDSKAVAGKWIGPR